MQPAFQQAAREHFEKICANAAQLSLTIHEDFAKLRHFSQVAHLKRVPAESCETTEVGELTTVSVAVLDGGPKPG